MKKIYFFVFFMFSVFLSIAQTTENWGMTYQGGDYGAGCIFKTNSVAENQTVVYSFFQYEGRTPIYTRFCEANNGKLYGLTNSGGIESAGVLFEFDPSTHNYIVKVRFDGEQKGRSPYGSLILASNGKLYGMTNSGGTNNKGVIFDYDVSSETYTKLVDFDGTTKGGSPRGSLVQAANGNLYGLSIEGGNNSAGLLFEYNITTSSFSVKHHFDGSLNGGAPNGTLMLASNGKLYGTTTLGGTNDEGIIFEYDPVTEIFVKKIDVDKTVIGNNCYELMQADNDTIYGLSINGGANDKGAFFNYDISSNLCTKIIDFDGTNLGAEPKNVMMQFSNGKLYGMAYGGGTNGYGTIYEYDPTTQIFTKKHDFILDDGTNPLASFVMTSTGKVFCLIYRGGISGGGCISEYNPTTNIYTRLIDFGASDDGKEPYGSLVLGDNNKLYGITNSGGINNAGVIFEFDPKTNIYSKKIDFADNNGYSETGFMQADNGKFYGLSSEGGANSNGVLYEYDPVANTLTNKYDFYSASFDAAEPYGYLIQATNGKLYGTSNSGGTNGDGTIFEYNISDDAFNVKVNFDAPTTGASPYAGLVQAENGKLYGTNTQGGTNDYGIIYEYDISSEICTKLFDFDNTNTGSFPFASMIQSSKGNLYGVTQDGGANSAGVLFKFNAGSKVFENLYDFELSTGSFPAGELIEGENGKMYGMTTEGGTDEAGVVFEFDTLTNVYLKKMDFSYEKGSNPYGRLIQISVIYDALKENFAENNISVYPNPSAGLINIVFYDININQKIEIEIVNIEGKKIYNESFTNTKSPIIDLSFLEKGIYLMKIITSQGVFTKKISKK